MTLAPIPDPEFDRHFGNLTNASFDPINLSRVASAPYTDIFSSIFWGIVFALIFIAMWLRMDDITIPALVGLIIGGSLWILMPADWVAMAASLTVVSLAGLVFSLIKKR